MVRHKNQFSPFPSKGTKRRVMLAMLFREQGATAPEIEETVGVKTNALGGNLSHFRNDCGVDIRAFPITPPTTGNPVVYKVIGIMKWSGSYRSFVDPAKYIAPRSQQKDRQ